MQRGFFGAVVVIAVALGSAPCGAQSAKRQVQRVGDELVGTSWQAKSLNGKPASDPALMTIDFLKAGDQVRGQAGCNRFVGPFASRGDKVTMGILRQSRDTCPPEQAAMQKTFIDLLHAAWQTEISGNELTFTGREGQQIVLTSRPR